MTLKILVADDEKPSRDKIIRFIKRQRPDAVVQEAQDGIEAVGELESRTPDLMFLDIRMPGMGGFDLIERIGAINMPPVVFITAYDEYAVQAFEVHAVDYLLKPFTFERFQVAFDRALDSFSQQETLQGRIDLMLADLTEAHRKKDQGFSDRLMVKKEERIILVDTKEILFIESQGKYAKIHTLDQSHLMRRSLQSLQDQLDPRIFFRIHRSSIVNITFVKELQAWFHGDYHVILKDGRELKLSRRYSRDILDQMG